VRGGWDRAEKGNGRYVMAWRAPCDGLTSRFAQSFDERRVCTGEVTISRQRREVGEGTMQYLLILLVVITMACGAAASVTIALAPAYADASGKGY